MANIIEINFIVGDLPEWYEEELHDWYVENWLEQVAYAQFGEDIEKVNVEYVYSGDHFIQAWNDEGDLVSEVPFDMNGAFEAAHKEIS